MDIKNHDFKKKRHPSSERPYTRPGERTPTSRETSPKTLTKPNIPGEKKTSCVIFMFVCFFNFEKEKSIP